MSTPPTPAPSLVPAPRLLLSGLTLLAFATAIPNGFAGIDHWQVESGGLIAHSGSELLQSLRAPLGAMPGWEGTAPYARPMVVTLLSLMQWCVGAQPIAFHAFSVALHWLAVLLAYALLRDLAVEKTTAFFATAVFAVHPVQTAAVTWISGIADPVFAVFLLLALRLHLAADTRAQRRWLFRLGALLSFAAALGAKETAATFPFLLVAVYLCLPRRLLAGAADRPVRFVAAVVTPYLLVLAADFAYRFTVLRASAVGAAFGTIPLAVRLRTVPRLVWSYLTLPLRIPALTVCDDYRVSVAWDAPALIALIALAAVIAIGVRQWRARPRLVFGLAWTLILLLPVLNVVPILHYRADRFFYLPLLGWALCAVKIVDAVFVRHLHQRFRLAAGGLLLMLLVAMTAQRNRLFTDDVTLFESTLRVSPHCREAHTALGDAYLRVGRNADAVEQYEQARVAQPERAAYVVMPKVLINLGMAQLARNDAAAAEAAFREAHQLQPELLHPLFGLGIANLGLGHIAEGVTWLEQAYAHDPNDADIIFNLALGYDRLNRPAEAVRFYRRYLEGAPRGRARGLATARLQVLSPPS